MVWDLGRKGERMKITVINGSMRHGSTWHCMDALRQALAERGPIEVKEFFLPKDMPHFCAGCYACFLNGEEACPHAASVRPIAEALLACDLIILTSAVYAMDVTGQMKALLDHLCYQWISHRPNPKMFDKIGLTVVTTAGAGLRHTTKTLKNSLIFWGVKKIYTFRMPVAAMRWSEVSSKKTVKIQKQTRVLAARIAQTVQHAPRLRTPLPRKLLFAMMAKIQKNNDWSPADRKYWEAHGWLNGTKPF